MPAYVSATVRQMQSWPGSPGFDPKPATPVMCVQPGRVWPVASGAPTIWVQLGIWNQEAAEYGESKGLTVVMDRCTKVEHARFNGGLHLLGFNTGQITARKTIR